MTLRFARGYSLAELVIVIVIAAILAAIAIPQFNQSAIDATWYHEQVRAGVRYAQRTAVAQRRCIFVSVTAPQVALFDGGTNCVITATPVVQLATGQAVVLVAPAGVVLSPAPNNFWFNGLGQPSGATGITVGSRSIVVNAETGYVQ
jgi:MSHA pilin protein MshC